jgi:hypothetical protein
VRTSVINHCKKERGKVGVKEGGEEKEDKAREKRKIME